MLTPAEKQSAPASANSGLRVSIRRRFPSSDHGFSFDLEFDAGPGFTIVFGPSGAGKTTLLDCVAGLATPDAGRISIEERVFFNAGWPDAKKPDSGAPVNVPVAKRGVGYVLQDLALFPHLTVEQNTEYGLAHLPRSTRKQRVAAVLEEFRIDHLCRQLATKISGGERQRLALARTLVCDPCTLLLDEPLSALDAATKARIIDDLRRWNEVHRIPILYVTHSREEVMALGERVLVMDQGRIIAQGTPHEVLRAPLQETVAQLAGFENIFDATVESVHEDRGTMLCRILPRGFSSDKAEIVLLETPLIRAEAGVRLCVGIRAGDILLATAKPEGLSARYLMAGRTRALGRRVL